MTDRSDYFARVVAGGHDDVEAVLAALLHGSGEWSSPRTSDGLESWRVVASDPDHVQGCGRIWTIDQVLHGFWLEIARDGDAVTWTVCFDVAGASPRRVRDAIDSISAPEEVEWRLTISGRA